MGYPFRLAARVLLYASSHRQDNTYHGLCCTSRGALAGTRNSPMGVFCCCFFKYVICCKPDGEWSLHALKPVCNQSRTSHQRGVATSSLIINFTDKRGSDQLGFATALKPRRDVLFSNLHHSRTVRGWGFNTVHIFTVCIFI